MSLVVVFETKAVVSGNGDELVTTDVGLVTILTCHTQAPEPTHRDSSRRSVSVDTYGTIQTGKPEVTLFSKIFPKSVTVRHVRVSVIRLEVHLN